MLFSVGTWINRYINYDLFELIKYLQIFYLTDIGIFLIITSANKKNFNQIAKSFIKLFFSVWIMIFVLISSISQLEQNIYIAYLTFIIGYLEVLFELNDIIKESILVINLNVLKLRYTKNETLSNASQPLTILIVSIMHIILSFVIQDTLYTLIQ